MSETIQTLLQENRSFPPSPDFANQANVSDPKIYAEAAADPEAFWESWAKQLDWFEPWHTVCEFTPPNAKWFIGGKINAAYNCVDRHAFGPRKDKPAIIWEAEPGNSRTITYGELKNEVSQLANALKALGVGKGASICRWFQNWPL